MSEPDRAAAVPFRQHEGQLQFLLVHLEHHDAWTFPKGSIEPKWDGGDRRGAALREACEEAGVHGDLDDQPLTRYAYPGGREPGERCVEAYLLRVLSQKPPRRKERFRHPTWVTTDEARTLLAAGRERRYAEEHARVLDEALERLAERGWA